MKKLIVAMLFMASILTVTGQELGVKAGVNLSNWKDSGGIFTSNKKARTAFHFGVYATFDLGETFALQPELLYSQKGVNFSDSDVEYNLTYLDIPIMFKYKLSDSFSLEVGPQLGFLMGAEIENALGTTDAKEFFQNVEYAAALGTSYKTNMGLTFGLRYNLGLSNVIAIDGITSEIKNNVFQFSLAYSFN